MFDGKQLALDFVKHVAACNSARLLCSCGISAESWFQVELAYMLASSGNNGRFGFEYPESRQRADLSVATDAGNIVFELKCFVKGADQNKIQEWPKQLDRLGRLVRTGSSLEGVAVSTFFGYSEAKESKLLHHFYPFPWIWTGPMSFFDEAPLHLAVATLDAVGLESGE